MPYRRAVFTAAFALVTSCLACGPGQAAAPGTAPPAQSGPQTATPPPPPNGQQVHRDVIAQPRVGVAAINKGAPPPQDFPTPVIKPKPNTAAPPPQR